MFEYFVPIFSDRIFEAYNAKLPDDINAYKNIDAFLRERGFSKKQMPTAKPQCRRFMYWNGDKRINVMVHYAGDSIRVHIPAIRTEAELSQKVLPDFISRHVLPYIGEPENK